MIIDKSIFFIWAIWYCYIYGQPQLLIHFMVRFYNFYEDFFNYYNKMIHPDYWEDESEEKEITKNKIEINTESPKEPSKYEDKYLEDIRKLSKDWEFTEEENNELPKLIEDFYKGYIDSKTEKIEEITEKIEELEKEISQDGDTVNFVEDFDEDGDELMKDNTLEERNEIRNSEIKKLQEDLIQLKTEINTEDGLDEIKKVSEQQSINYIIDRRLDRVKNCYVIEKTPIGNVLMIYEKNRESFKYYSDSNIPYRYLEVVGRKYVKLFGCRPIFIDMEEELRLFEEKWDKEQEFKKIKQEEDKKRRDEAVKNNQSVEVKKNVFAKFKSYNKDAGGKISMAAPPKNSIPNKNVNENKENEKIILKERANRYTYEGKFANFNFLQKIERKVFNKKLGLSFSDFKKMKK
jgi:hypothetical protein